MPVAVTPEQAQNADVTVPAGGEEAPADEEQLLWSAWKDLGNAEARTALLLRYLPMARTVSRSIFRTINPNYVELADLVQIATVGLLECIERYDPARGVPFAVYAKKRMRGAVYNGLESQSELHAQSVFRRRMRQERLRILREANGKKSSDVFTEMVELALGLAVGLLLEGTALFHESEGVGAKVAYSESGQLHTQSQYLQQKVATLPENERRVLELHYFHGISFAEIASVLGLTRGRVSQIHTRALKRLREESKLGRRLDRHL